MSARPNPSRPASEKPKPRSPKPMISPELETRIRAAIDAAPADQISVLKRRLADAETESGNLADMLNAERIHVRILECELARANGFIIAAMGGRGLSEAGPAYPPGDRPSTDRRHR